MRECVNIRDRPTYVNLTIVRTHEIAALTMIFQRRHSWSPKTRNRNRKLVVLTRTIGFPFAIFIRDSRIHPSARTLPIGESSSLHSTNNCLPLIMIIVMCQIVFTRRTSKRNREEIQQIRSPLAGYKHISNIIERLTSLS